jgi:hypothetical protein
LRADVWRWCTASRWRLAALGAGALLLVAALAAVQVRGGGAPGDRAVDARAGATADVTRPTGAQPPTGTTATAAGGTGAVPPAPTLNPANTADIAATSTVIASAPSSTAPAPRLPSTTNPPLLLDPLVEIRTDVVAIGDSVMLSAADRLRAFATVDARTSRPPREALARLDVVTGQMGFDGLVVLHTGTNGPLPANFADRLDAALGDRQPLILMTDLAPDRAYIQDNNRIIRALASRPHTTILDWDALAAGCPGRCFYSDGIHLLRDGQAFFADLVRTAVADVQVAATTTTSPSATSVAPAPSTTTLAGTTTTVAASPTSSSTTVPTATARRVVAVTATGAAVYFPSPTASPVTLFTPSPATSATVDGVAVAPDLSRAWVALCCDPDPEIRTSTPPAPITLGAATTPGRRPVVSPDGALLARGVADDVVSVEPIDASRRPVTAPHDASFVTTDVAWVDATTIVVLGDQPSRRELRWYRVQAARLTLLGTSTVAWGDAADAHVLGGVLGDGRVAVHQAGDATVRAHALADSAPDVVDLPTAARSAWFDRAAELVYVDTSGVLHVGSTTLNGDYLAARR